MNKSATTTKTLSADERWTNAVKLILEEGVLVRENIDACCPSCVKEDLYDEFVNTDETFVIAWTFGGDGNAYEWDDTDTMVYQDDHSPIESIHFYQRVFYQQNSSGSIIAAAFRANGFLVRWDGDEYSLIQVFPNENGSRQDEYVLVS